MALHAAPAARFPGGKQLEVANGSACRAGVFLFCVRPSGLLCYS